MWLLILVAQTFVVDLPRSVELGEEAVEITLIEPSDAEARQRLSSMAADPAENLVLHLRGVEADEDPGASWEIYVASSDEADCDNVPALAGILSLYGAPPSAAFVFPLDAAVDVSKPVGLKVIFRPTSGLVFEGEPIPPTIRTSVRIGSIGLETEDGVAFR